jgi:elongation factor P--(R)-beta-lysine ligase
MSDRKTVPLSWQPSCTPATARRRAQMLTVAREFFAARGVLEVETPMLGLSAVSDPNIDSVHALLELDRGRHRYLHTSPEYRMKRLLCAGYPDIYSICKVFRDGEAGKRHQPEFTMAEWYRKGFGLQDMIRDSCDFITQMLDAQWLPGAVESISYREAFIRHAGLDPLQADCSALAVTVDADNRLQATMGDHRDDWLDLVMSRRIAPALAKDRLTVVHHYPASQAMLARICPDDASLADRFEIFLGDIELANGYVELLDADVQWQRWQADQDSRRRKARALLPLDETLIGALRSGMPPCAGVAVGFDRLLMINEQCDDIARVQTFAFERSQGA